VKKKSWLYVAQKNFSKMCRGRLRTNFRRGKKIELDKNAHLAECTSRILVTFVTPPSVHFGNLSLYRQFRVHSVPKFTGNWKANHYLSF
jgi:hypothetical protein